MKYELILSGIGGQGILLAGQLLCSAAVKKGHLVTWAPTYGQEKRGGRTMCQIVISDEVGSPVVSEADIVLVMDEKSLVDYGKMVRCGGWMIVNSSLIKTISDLENMNIIEVPFMEIAAEVGNIKTANMVALGTLARHLGLIEVDKLKEELSVFFPRAKSNLIDLNKKAILRGYEYGA